MTILPRLLLLLPCLSLAIGADLPTPASPAPFTPHQVPAVGGPDTCAFCHLAAPTSGAADTRLRIPVANICISCHNPAVHAGSAVHAVLLPDHARGAVESAGLRLLPDGRMGCLTCHDPHPAGVLPGSDARRPGIGRPLYPARWRDEVLLPVLRQREQALGVPLRAVTVEPDLLRRPLAGGVLCETCHGGICSSCHDPATFDHPGYQDP
jgi:hypothetical protein